MCFVFSESDCCCWLSAEVSTLYAEDPHPHFTPECFGSSSCFSWMTSSAGSVLHAGWRTAGFQPPAVLRCSPLCSPVHPVWQNWTWTGTTWRLQMFRSSWIWWRVQTANWRLWGQWSVAVCPAAFTYGGLNLGGRTGNFLRWQQSSGQSKQPEAVKVDLFSAALPAVHLWLTGEDVNTFSPPLFSSSFLSL